MNGSLKRVVLGAAALAFAAGCAGVVKSTRLSPEWETTDKNRVKRLVILTHPYPAGDEALGQAWSKLAAKRVDLKREFIVLEKHALPGQPPMEPDVLCSAPFVEGVLWLQPSVAKKGEGVEAAVTARLIRCVDAAEIWATEAAGSWASQDEKLKETIADYVADFGPGVEPYIAASYHLLNDTLDTLPNPVLTEEDQGDKIENTQ